jgi:pyridoxine/pyridoxamine 5'-phosphate oxidase
VTPAEILGLIRRYRLAVVSTVATDGAPQGAVVGFAISDTLEIVFDTLASTRKHQNLKRDPRAALVIGWDDELTFQIDGRADFPTGEELLRMQACYFTLHPDGRDRLSWPGITYVRVRPTLIRMSDFKQDPPRIIEVTPRP